jgi:hypothetical protein
VLREPTCGRQRRPDLRAVRPPGSDPELVIGKDPWTSGEDLDPESGEPRVKHWENWVIIIVGIFALLACAGLVVSSL